MSLKNHEARVALFQLSLIIYHILLNLKKKILKSADQGYLFFNLKNLVLGLYQLNTYHILVLLVYNIFIFKLRLNSGFLQHDKLGIITLETAFSFNRSMLKTVKYH